jgi:hypothetical protein
MKIICLILFFLAVPSFAKSNSDGFTAYAAVGENLRPFSFRVGYGGWEIGQLNGMYGFDKVFHMNERFYAAMGFAYASSVGVYGAIGVKAHLWFIPIRCELASIIDVNGLNQSGALLGVTYGF